ncbi:hypothetical protein Pint_05303 [Pistacia integerrima]|uniref:Uncharacterized protein n=1 Tax=Pistacia integerrima TaxID=434235 RepID=A0ACC0Z7H7_9ROSI|nr:hypothetical protein Pint_05303 [Pistacia integerrima]
MIRRLTSHFESYKKNYLSQRALVKLIEKPRWWLLYSSQQNRVRYTELISQLKIQQSINRQFEIFDLLDFEVNFI